MIAQIPESAKKLLQKTRLCNYCNITRPLWWPLPDTAKMKRVMTKLPNGTYRCMWCAHKEEHPL